MSGAAGRTVCRWNWSDLEIEREKNRDFRGFVVKQNLKRTGQLQLSSVTFPTMFPAVAKARRATLPKQEEQLNGRV